MSKTTPLNTFPLLRETIYSLKGYPEIWLPYILLIFIQLFTLEVFYFAPRHPLVVFFGPIIKTFWGEQYLHYPYNLIKLPEQFQLIQLVIYIFVASYLIAVAIAVITDINGGQKVILRDKFLETLRMYVHIFLAACLIALSYIGLMKLYGLIAQEVYLNASKKWILFVSKKIIIDGAPYFSLLIGVFVTTLFAFVLPIIVIEKQKFFKALALNLKIVIRSFWLVLATVFLAHLPLGGILLLRSTLANFSDTVFPELRVLILIASLVIVVVIDAIIYTAITTYYLLKKETS